MLKYLHSPEPTQGHPVKLDDVYFITVQLIVAYVSGPSPHIKRVCATLSKIFHICKICFGNVFKKLLFLSFCFIIIFCCKISELSQWTNVLTDGWRVQQIFMRLLICTVACSRLDHTRALPTCPVYRRTFILMPRIYCLIENFLNILF